METKIKKRITKKQIEIFKIKSEKTSGHKIDTMKKEINVK